MMAVSQLDSGNERRGIVSHMLIAAEGSVHIITWADMYYAGAATVIKVAISLLRLTGWSSRISKFVTPDRISQKAAVELGDPAEGPRHDGFAWGCWGSFRDQGPGARGQLPGVPAGAERAEWSSDASLALTLSQKSAPWTYRW